MMSLLIRLLINTIGILLIATYVPGIDVTGYGSALLFALVLGVINAIIRPIIMILTMPINILTIGLFTFVINGILFWVASAFVSGVIIDSFSAAFWGALILSLISWLASFVFKK